MKDPISFATLSGLFTFTPDQVRDALSECGSIFLSTSESSDSGETLYQLPPPAVPFIGHMSENLPYFGALKRSVEHFKAVELKATPEEAVVIVKMDRLIRQRNFHAIVQLGKSFSHHDPVLANPRVRALLGQAYSELGNDYRESAREWFRAAEGLGYRDVFMMRRWYYMEFKSGYNLQEAERICRNVISDPRTTTRHKSEFLSKLGLCYYEEALANMVIGREKGLALLRQSALTYLEALWEGRNVKEIDPSETLTWLAKPLQQLVVSMREDIDQMFLLLEAILDQKHDVDENGIEVVFRYFARCPAPNDRKLRERLKGNCTRLERKANTAIHKSSFNKPGFDLLANYLARFRAGPEES